MGRVAALGCFCGSPAEVHHVKSLSLGCGMGKKSSNYDTIPLCPNHHRNGKEAFHNMGHRTWEAKYGSQLDMLAEVKQKLGIE